MADYDSETNRKKALKRALKMVLLLEPPHFARIMKAVDPAIGADFDPACAAAGLKPKERAWLKTYLDVCKDSVYKNVDEAAATGW